MRNEGMRQVKVKRDELLAKVRDNRKNHEDKYNKANAVYYEELVAAIQELLDDAKAGKTVSHCVSLAKPEQHLDEYDQAIAMLEMSVDDVVLLDQSEFAQYVMDKWSWARTFESNTIGYAAKFKG